MKEVRTFTVHGDILTTLPRQLLPAKLKVSTSIIRTLIRIRWRTSSGLRVCSFIRRVRFLRLMFSSFAPGKVFGRWWQMAILLNRTSVPARAGIITKVSPPR
ncbi:MAG: hypothetical protein IPK15_02235 [Verrucomicrobia bacterium]|nr:hypothetical protein [Verrucomicrobiota bacterium]